MSLQSDFLQEIQQSLVQPHSVSKNLELSDISVLPELLQNYLINSGFIGKPKSENLFMVWVDTYLKIKPEKEWMEIDCRQFNASDKPLRIALMQSKMFGFIPFSGKDKYQNGEGNMLIKLAGFTISNALGPEMNKAALVTFLSESVLLPGAILSDYITWRQTDSFTLNAVITDAGISVDGRFHFDDEGLLYRFETDERYYSTTGKDYKQLKWSAYYSGYKRLGAFTLPTMLKAVWHFPEGDYTYFKGEIKTIKYGITELKELGL